MNFKTKSFNSTVVFGLRAAIITVFLIWVFLCAYELPFSLLLETDGVSLSKPDMYFARLLFYYLASIPVFASLFICWRIVNRVKNGKVFTKETAKLFKTAAKLISIDSFVFLAGQTVFSVLNSNRYDIFFFIIGVFGLAAALIAYIVSHYADEAAEIKEENDSII